MALALSSHQSPNVIGTLEIISAFFQYRNNNGNTLAF